MNFKRCTQSPAQTSSACVVLPVLQDSGLTPAGAELDQSTQGLLGQIIERGDFKAKLGKTFLLPLLTGNTGVERILLVGLGETDKLTDSKFRKAAQAAYDHLAQLGLTKALIALAETPLKNRDGGWKLRLLAETAETSFYRFTEFKSAAPQEILPTELGFYLAEDQGTAGDQALLTGQAIGQGKNLARTLGNRPGNVCTPRHLAETAEALAAQDSAFSATILDEQQMAELGMHSLLSVGKGSDQPPRLIVIEYKGAADPAAQPHVLLGKGITFDSGGISLKPGEGMDEMKFDMCGAASVLGTLEAIRQLKPKLNLVFMIAAAENMPSGRASKPGDIYTTLSGKTVEVLNTDAEGRLVLCDALTYAERFNPASLIDIATLTGACIIALGHQASGLMSNDEDLAATLLQAGIDAEDRAWQLPIWEEYQEQLDSNFADLQNIGGRPAGSITAACFLARFAEKYRWAHLDIAGTAWHSGKLKGATGRPVGLLVEYLLQQDAAGQA